jgi:hypothetical protein
MTDNLKNIIREEVAKLPQEQQEAIASVNWVAITEEIGRRYVFEEEALNDFQTETLLVLLGLELPQFFSINVENNVGVGKEDAQRIATEIQQRVFAPINTSMLDKVKKSERIKRSNLQQNINFIMSGGRFSELMDPRAYGEAESQQTPSKE